MGVDKIRVTFAGRLKHADLYEAAKRVGGGAAMGRLMEIGGTNPSSPVCRWINMRGVPPRRFEKVLYELTGKLYDDLFPPELIAAIKSGHPRLKRIEMTAEVPIARLIGSTQDLLPPPQEEYHVKEFIERALDRLPDNERRVVAHRYGLDGHSCNHTLDETAEHMDLSRERIRQIESRALRRMRNPKFMGGEMRLGKEGWT